MTFRIRRFLLAALLGLIAVFSFPALLTEVHSAAPGPETPIAASAATAESPLKQGIEQYEAGQYTAAIAAWRQALTAAERDGERLQQALLYSNLSLAYQQLGQEESAEAAIAASLALLTEGAAEEQSSAYYETFAKALNAQGRLQWSQGDLSAALDTWRQAAIAYDQAGHVPGIVLSQINQAKALQAQGLHVQAKVVLEQVYQILQRQALSPQLKATGLWHLGIAYRHIGELQKSLERLEESLRHAETLQSSPSASPLVGLVGLDLGNTRRAFGDRASAIGQDEAAAEHRTQALTAYQKAAGATKSLITKTQAQLNQLSLLIEMGELSEAQDLWPTLAINDLPLNRAALFAKLNFARSQTALKQALEKQALEEGTAADKASRLKAATDAKMAAGAAPDWMEIGQFLAGVAQQSRELEDPIAESYALGQLGNLYEVTGQWSDAQDLTEQALQLAEAAQYPDGRYRWEWQLGRLLKQQDKPDQAITAYSEAVKTLESVRDDLLFIDSDIQFSFRDNVEPVYRQLVELLVSGEAGQDADQPSQDQPSQEYLGQAIQRIDNLQLNELENFLGCNLAQTLDPNQATPVPTAAILYPMILEERLAVILQLPDQDQPLQFHQVMESRKDVEKVLQTLRQDLSEAPDRTPEVLEKAEMLYQWLIEPFEPVLAQDPEIDTLVFVLDGPLRNIPMAVLRHNNQYLIQKYAIAVAPRLALFNPTPISSELAVFVGGVGESQTIKGRTFEKIEYLVDELQGIGKDVNTNPPLIDADFTTDNLKHQLGAEDFSVVHLKTHGVFSSDPEETFIVAYQELIHGRDLGSLIQAGNRQTETPLELLVLSACSTAQGDNRAVLGLAGIAVQAGVRSAISTLWEAQDAPNTKLMIRFYEELSTPGTTRAQALRRAQLDLFKRYPAPHIWGTYVLVGNWL
ncbi:MAG: CHAT domain-containing protein [Leptolyngbyaceae cyanobacterium MO_188.B28]|nr:CHAT domain-containing protein [Leptolyngbyaceae cyanobacterium MO_188.B28]